MNGENFRKTVLANGVRILTERVPWARSISIGVWVDLGSRDEEEGCSGISHFIEHMLFKGTRTRTALDIAKAFDMMGGASNAFTSRETVCFYARVMSSHEDDIVELLSDIFLNSTFPYEEVERERYVVLQEISMVEDSPEELTYELFYQNFWPDSGLGRPVLGIPQTVRSFRDSDLPQYVKTRFTPGRVIVSCAGSVDHDLFTRKVERFFGNLDSANGDSIRERPYAKKGINVVQKDLEQVNVLVGLEGPSQRDKKRFPALVLNVILGGSMGSRLFQEIREKRGLAYSVYSFHTGYSDTGLVGMYAGVRPEKAYDVLALMISELERLAQDWIGKKELDRAKEYLRGGVLLSSESTDARMSRMTRLEMALGEYYSIDEVLRRIDAVDQNDILCLAKEYLQADKAILILGNCADSQLHRIEGLIKDETP